MTYILVILALAALLASMILLDGWATFGGIVFAATLGICAIVHHENDPEVIAADAKDVAQAAATARAEATPHVIREADGCKVYTFKSGDLYHYFTRCPNSQTTTEAYHKVTETHSCGKTTCSTTKLVGETITNEGI